MKKLLVAMAVAMGIAAGAFASIVNLSNAGGDITLVDGGSVSVK